MFHAPIDESSNFTPLRQAGVHSSLTDEWIEQALRVCKRRVVVKDRFDSPVFEQFHMERKLDRIRSSISVLSKNEKRRRPQNRGSIGIS